MSPNKTYSITQIHGRDRWKEKKVTKNQTPLVNPLDFLIRHFQSRHLGYFFGQLFISYFHKLFHS